MPTPAAVKPSNGATIPGTMTFSTSPGPGSALAPLETNAEPTGPPISACDELDGRPKYHVARFQAMAPMRPAKTTVVVTASESTMPLPTVAATFSEMKAPAKFSTADSRTAKRGDIARVDTDVAIALAVSWKPLVKSKASAVATTMTRTTSEPTVRLGVLDHDALKRVGHVLARVDRLFEALEDVLPPDDDQRVDAALEQRGDGVAADAVAVVLQAVDLDRVVRDGVERAQARHRLGDLARGLQQHVRQALRLLHRGLDLVEAEVVGDLVDEVDDVVQRADQVEDVLAVDRRDEGLIEVLVDVVRDPIALLLADDD